jgi:hypothetical protein
MRRNGDFDSKSARRLKAKSSPRQFTRVGGSERPPTKPDELPVPLMEQPC